MRKWYVVYKGKVPGVYDQWDHVHEQVNRFPGNSHKSYKSKEEAKYRYMMFQLAEERKSNKMKTFVVILAIFIVMIAIVLYVVVV
jgi:ribonuclease HI